MLTGFDIRYIEDVVGRDNGLSLEGLKLACILFGIKVVGQWTSEPWKIPTYGGTREYPSSCLLHARRYGSNKTHAMVCTGNVVDDPNGKTYYSFPENEYEFLAYLEIEVETGWKPCVEIIDGKERSFKRGCSPLAICSHK